MTTPYITKHKFTPGDEESVIMLLKKRTWNCRQMIWVSSVVVWWLTIWPYIFIFFGLKLSKLSKSATYRVLTVKRIFWKSQFAFYVAICISLFYSAGMNWKIKVQFHKQEVINEYIIWSIL